MLSQKDKFMIETWTELSVPLDERLFHVVDDYLKKLGSVGNVIQTLVGNEGKTTSATCIKGYLPGSTDDNEKEIKIFTAFISSLQGFFPSGRMGEVGVEETSQKEWEGWKNFFKATAVSDRVIIKPSWEDYLKKEGEVVVDIDPGMAFGTGTHETTRLCIMLLDRIIKGGEALLDLGTGSGILAITAAKLGALKVMAIDNDESVIRIAHDNCVNNGVEHLIDVSAASIDSVTAEFDIIVANILAETLINLKKDVIRRIKKGGMIILSGILAQQVNQVVDAYVKGGAHLADVLEEGEWRALMFRR